MRWPVSLACLLLSCAAGAVELHIPRLSAPPKLEEFATMRPEGPVARSMVRVSEFIQREPKDGAPATQKTDAYLGYDHNNFYAVFVCFDTRKEGIRARLSRRDDVFSDDSVEIMLDTFHDQRRSYVFTVTAL